MERLSSLIKKAQNDKVTMRNLFEQSIESHQREGQLFYELLQNAEDAEASQIKFIMHKDRLEVFHDGRPFTLSNLNALCDFARSDKKNNLNQIGQFGIGFKAVFRICETVQLYSQPSHYRMPAPDAQPAFGLSIVDFREPVDIPFEDIAPPYTTRFIFPFACGYSYSGYETIEDLRKNLSEQLHRLGPSTLLFMKNLRAIEHKIIFDKTSEEGKYFLSKKKLSKICTLLSANAEIKRQGEKRQATNISDVSYLKFSKLINERSERTVDIAFIVKEHENGTFKCISNKTHKISVYFPTETDSKLHFIVQGPLRTEPNRSFVPEHKDNAKLVDITSELLKEAIIELRNMNMLNTSFISALPINKEDFGDNHLYEPLCTETWKLLADEGTPILPAQNGGFVSIDHAVYASRSDFIDIFTDEQLTEALSLRWGYKKIHYRWATSELNKKQFQRLLDNLQRGERKITRFNLRDFVLLSNLDSSFLTHQTTEWLIKFYNYVDKHGGVECEQNYHQNMLTMEFVRTSEGEFVSPYTINQGTYEPNVFLPIESIAGAPCHDFQFVDKVLYESCRHFFESILHLKKPDEFAYRVASIKERYSEDYLFSEESHIDDVHFLLDEKYSITRKQDVKDVFLLRCSDGQMRCAAKEQIYVPKEGSINIKAYLKDVADDVYFIDYELYSRYNIKGDSLEFLGVKTSLVTGEATCSGTYITDHPGPNPKWKAPYFSWLLNIKYISDVLYYIQTHPLELNSRQKSRAIIEILCKHETELRGDVEISRQYHYEYSLIIYILQGNLKKVSDMRYRLNLKNEIPYISYDGSAYAMRIYNNSSFEYLEHFKWLYTESGEWVSPRDITKLDLCRQVYGKTKESKIYDYLGFRKDPADLCKDLMINSTEQERYAFFVSECKRTFGYQPDELRRVLTKNTRVQIDDGGEDEEFPCARVKNWHLLQKHVAEELVCASPVEYKYLVRHIRTSKDYAIVDEYLKNMYASRESKACACQMCHQFSGRRCSEQLFNHPEVELSSMNLNLCPKCAREYKTLRSDDGVMQRFRQDILDLSEEDIGSSDPVSISLQDHDIWFTQIHIAEIRESLRLQREKKENDEEMTSLD